MPLGTWVIAAFHVTRVFPNSKLFFNLFSHKNRGEAKREARRDMTKPNLVSMQSPQALWSAGIRQGVIVKLDKTANAAWFVACSRLSDSGEDAKIKGTRKVDGAKKRKRKGERGSVVPALPSFLPFYFSSSRFLRPNVSRSLEQATWFAKTYNINDRNVMEKF